MGRADRGRRDEEHPQPRVAVVIPTFNRASLVGRAIASVLAQTMPEFELVVVDDGSTDDTAAVVAEIADPRLRLVRIANRGEGGARNAGVAATTAPLLAYLDSDNEWRPTFLADLLAALRPGDVLVQCGMELVEVGGPAPGTERARTVFSCSTPTASTMFADGSIDSSQVLHRRSVFPDVGLWSEEVRPAEWEFYGRIVLRYPGRVRALDRPLLTYYRYDRELLPQLSSQPIAAEERGRVGREAVRARLEAFAREHGRWDDPLPLSGPLRARRPTTGCFGDGWTAAAVECVVEALAPVTSVRIAGTVAAVRPPAELRAWEGDRFLGALAPGHGRFEWELPTPLMPGEELRLRIETSPPFEPAKAGSPDVRTLGFLLSGISAR